MTDALSGAAIEWRKERDRLARATEPKRRNGHANVHAASELVALDERNQPPAREDVEAPAAMPPPIEATPFRWTDPALIPPRRWIYGRHYIRQFLTETVAPGAYGKSTLAITEALAISAGRDLLGVTPNESVNVWYFNGEDPMEELQRRIAAACIHYQIEPAELEGRLFVDTGRQTKIILAEMRQQLASKGGQ